MRIVLILSALITVPAWAEWERVDETGFWATTTHIRSVAIRSERQPLYAVGFTAGVPPPCPNRTMTLDGSFFEAQAGSVTRDMLAAANLALANDIRVSIAVSDDRVAIWGRCDVKRLTLHR